MALIKVTTRGLYCARGDFYIDPWKPVNTALITHAHADHAYPGHETYYAVAVSTPVLRHRLGADLNLTGVAYGEPIQVGDVRVSFHPAGHVLGSAQIRLACDGEVWVVTGDYKRAHDPTCDAFEVVPCDVLITEATFGLPVYRWQPGSEMARSVLDWWRGFTGPGILFCYAFGKAQRVLAELHALTDQTVYLHGAMVELTRLYREAGVAMLPTKAIADLPDDFDYNGALILAPPSAHRSPWMKRFKKPHTAFASGWMQVRGNRRRRGYERGFVLSDHADWPALVQTVRDCGAKQVYVTHGQNQVFARYLREVEGVDALPLDTLFEGEGG